MKITEIFAQLRGNKERRWRKSVNCGQHAVNNTKYGLQVEKSGNTRKHVRKVGKKGGKRKSVTEKHSGLKHLRKKIGK